MILLKVLSLLSPVIHALGSAIYCSRYRYGVPTYPDCRNLLDTIPALDDDVRLFAEEELQVALTSSTNWPQIQDSRPESQGHSIVQVPKIWSLGTSFPFPNDKV